MGLGVSVGRHFEFWIGFWWLLSSGFAVVSVLGDRRFMVGHGAPVVSVSQGCGGWVVAVVWDSMKED